MGHSGECVPPLRAHLIRDIFVATGEGYWLKGDRLNLVDILCSKLYDLADAVVIDVVDDRYNQCDFYTNACEVLNRSKLHVKEITNTSMLVLLFAYAVKLQVNAVLTCRFRLLAELDVFGKADSISRSQNSVESNLLRVFNCFEVIRRQRWFSA